jgi:hypothetical protein
MQEIQHGITLAGFFFVARREHDAVVNAAVQEFALEGAAINPALSQAKGADEQTRNKYEKPKQVARKCSHMPKYQDSLCESLCPLW